jgi:rsbT co-antagonist protein RsbR
VTNLDQTVSAAGSPFTGEEQAALQDVWLVYERDFQDIMTATLSAVETDSDFSHIAAGMTTAQMEAEQLRSKQLLQHGMQDGVWQPLLADIRQQGGYYARLGLPFSSWFVVVTAAQRVLLERLIQAYGGQPQRMQAAVLVMNKWLFDVTLASVGEEYLSTREHVIRQQQLAIQELSTPVLPLRPGLLLLPVIGVIDSQRARQLTEQLLEGIRAHRAKVVVMDLTGVPAVDSAVANHLLQTVRAAKLLGAHTVVTGISTENAQTLTRIGVDLSNLRTTSDLQSGIEEAEWLIQAVPGEREPGSNHHVEQQVPG